MHCIVIFHAVTGLDATASAEVQAQGAPALGWRLFVRRGLLPADDAQAMARSDRRLFKKAAPRSG
ncbi:MAG: hypothetical protein IT521_07160 [Burkholderiales bacterium]|nr:hypothetical protein [Burkholderiales bacterium]